MSRLQRISFEGGTLAELVRQCRAFIGESETALTIAAFGSGSVINTWPVPSWAPKGSRWVASNAPPSLRGPDGKTIEVRWSAGTPQKP